jgi:hypothetical protein
MGQLGQCTALLLDAACRRVPRFHLTMSLGQPGSGAKEVAGGLGSAADLVSQAGSEARVAAVWPSVASRRLHKCYRSSEFPPDADGIRLGAEPEVGAGLPWEIDAPAVMEPVRIDSRSTSRYNPPLAWEEGVQEREC